MGLQCKDPCVAKKGPVVREKRLLSTTASCEPWKLGVIWNSERHAACETSGPENVLCTDIFAKSEIRPL